MTDTPKFLVLNDLHNEGKQVIVSTESIVTIFPLRSLPLYPEDGPEGCRVLTVGGNARRPIDVAYTIEDLVEVLRNPDEYSEAI